MEENEDENSFETDKMVRKWYKTCVNETQIEKLGVQPLQNRLKKLGGWPVLDENDVESYSSFRWYEQVRKLNVEGFPINTIMRHDIGTDDKNNSYRIIKLDQPKLGLDREYLIAGFDDNYVQN